VDEMEVVLTGKVFSKEIEPYVDSILEIDHVKVDNTK
jgi:cob(I)alamin adenosyltransferase